MNQLKVKDLYSKTKIKCHFNTKNQYDLDTSKCIKLKAFIQTNVNYPLILLH